MTIINNQLQFLIEEAKTEKQKCEVVEYYFEEICMRVEDAIKEQKHLILFGEPGSAKSSLVNSVVSNYKNVAIRKNKLSGVQLYEVLYKSSKAGQTLILDDCDSWYDDKVCHSTLMAATDTDSNAIVHWNDNSDLLKRRGIPHEFVFKGNIIVITNKPMIERLESLKPQDIKINQILSRMPSLNVNFPDNKWNFRAIKIWHEAGALECFNESSLDQAAKDDIIDFIDEQKDRIRRLSFRTVAHMVKTRLSRGGNNWKKSAMFDLV